MILKLKFRNGREFGPAWLFCLPLPPSRRIVSYFYPTFMIKLSLIMSFAPPDRVMSVKAISTMFRQLKTTSAFNRSFTLSYVIPGKGNQVETETFLSAKSFRDAFPGFRFTNPKTRVTLSASCLPNHIDPSVIYTAKHPFLAAQLEDYSYNQISDKAFEDRACKALEHHLIKSFAVHRRIPDNPTRPDSWRILAGEKDVAEWEGVWVGHDGHVFLLEAKHLMDAVSFVVMIPFILFTYAYRTNFMEFNANSFKA